MDKFFSLIKKFIPRKIFKAFQPVYHYILSWSSAFFYGFPAEKMVVIGITGTIGKTTTAYLLLRTLKECGYKVGLTSTAIFDDGEKEWLNDKRMTMVGRFFLQGLLAKMLKNGCQFAIVETTSEGIRQFRHRFINYDWLIFTGLYPEHIESHGSFENYKKAKGKLFEHLKKCKTKYSNQEWLVVNNSSGLDKLNFNRVRKTVVANLDDDHVEYFLSFFADDKIAYCLDLEKAKKKEDLPKDLVVEPYGNIHTENKGVSFKAFGSSVDLSIFGEFNAANAMAAACVARLAEKDLSKIKKGFFSIKGVAGRMENIDEGQPFKLIVDYAFEPNSLGKFYETVEKLPHNRIINVLGSAGGGRDVARRPKLGLLAGKRADFVIITNEDPYDDDPGLIIDQIGAGAETAGKKINQDYFKIPDRREAIAKAVSLAQEGDLVLITGKGSEQLIWMANGEKIPWDDRRVAREEILKSLNLKTQD